MSKIFKCFIVMAILLMSSITFAQERKLTEAQKEQATVKLEQYFEKLNLSEDQKQAYEAIAKKI